MTLQSSGIIYMSQIHGEFGRGHNLNAYRGTPWWTDAGASGTFSAGQIHMSEFYGKRASSPAGIATANYVWGGHILNTGSVVHLGGEAGNRYIAIMASSYSTVASDLTQCFLNGVSLPLLHYQEGSVLDTDANSHFQKAAIFGGYFPSGVDVTLQFRLANAANAGGDAYIVHLTGSNLTLRATASFDRNIAQPMAIPNKSIILASHAKAKHGTGIPWAGVTQIGAMNNGSDTIKLGWSSAAAWQYYETGGTVTVNGASQCAFVAVG